jgi:hypothetical protein
VVVEISRIILLLKGLEFCQQGQDSRFVSDTKSQAKDAAISAPADTSAGFASHNLFQPRAGAE